MATAAFKSNSRRSTANAYRGADSPKTEPPNPNPNPNPNPPPPSQKQRLRRSLSVSAVSRSTEIDVSEFLNKRDNPLYWATGGSAADNTTQTPTPVDASKSSNVVVGERGRSVKRNSDLGNNGGQKEEVIVGRRRSLSRVNDNGGGSGNVRRGRSVSRAKLPFGASESEAEQETRIPITYGGRSSSIRASSRNGKLPISGVKTFERSSQPSSSRHSSFDSQVPNWEDGVSTSSLSEAEEKTIKAVYEQMKSFEGDNFRKDTTSTEIYETVRSEVRRAIADIQDDLQDAIRRNTTGALVGTNVTDISPKLVKTGAVDLVLDIRREYAKELEESQERARKLRSDLAIEEHRRQELNRILKETLPEPKTSVSHRSRLGRKSSNERKKISKRLTDEAMSYFDECVSISTFDSSDFSAAEDPSVNSMGPTASLPQEAIDRKMIHGDPGSGSIADSSSSGHVTNQVLETTETREWDGKSRFSFGQKPTESIEMQHDIKNYIRTFEKDMDLNGMGLKSSKTTYNVDVYDLLEVNERLLFDKVLFKNRQVSGSLHICGGVGVPFLPFSRLF